METRQKRYRLIRSHTARCALTPKPRYIRSIPSSQALSSMLQLQYADSNIFKYLTELWLL